MSHEHDAATVRPEHAHSTGFLRTYVFSLDHKIIGLQFLFSTLIWFFVGGMLALGVRWQLAYPWRPMPILGNLVAYTEGGQIAPETYTMLVTMHATIMIFFVIIPVLAGAFFRSLSASTDPPRASLDRLRPQTLNAGHPLNGAVAQLGERIVRNDEVRGSIPLSSTSGMEIENDCWFSLALAQ